MNEENQTTPYTDRISPYSEKTSPYSGYGAFETVLMQEDGWSILLEDNSKILL